MSSFQDLHYYSKICKVVYQSRESILQVLEDHNPIFLDLNNSEGVVFTKTEENCVKLIICFRGSNEVRDWIDNFMISRRKIYHSGDFYGKVHKGFYRYYKNLQEIVLSHIQKFINSEEYQQKDKEIVFCGHSSGGYSVLAAFEASFLENCPQISVYTFGSPRIGDRLFAKNFEERVRRCYRVVNGQDPVPLLPSKIRYKHVGFLVPLGGKGVKRNSLSQTILSFIKGLFNPKFDITDYIDISDHKISSYILELNKILQKID